MSSKKCILPQNRREFSNLHPNIILRRKIIAKFSIFFGFAKIKNRGKFLTLPVASATWRVGKIRKFTRYDNSSLFIDFNINLKSHK